MRPVTEILGDPLSTGVTVTHDTSSRSGMEMRTKTAQRGVRWAARQGHPN
jgi:hypothetical protein